MRDKHPHAKSRGIIVMSKRVRAMVSDQPPRLGVYFVRDTTRPRIKIGYSQCPLLRIKDISRLAGVPMKLLAIEPGGRVKERELHEMFADTALGYEWFKPSRAMREYLKRITIPSDFMRVAR